MYVLCMRIDSESLLCVHFLLYFMCQFLSSLLYVSSTTCITILYLCVLLCEEMIFYKDNYTVNYE